MITRVQALPVEEMFIIAENGVPEDVRIISIVDPDHPFVFGDDLVSDTIVQFKFDDVDPEWFKNTPVNQDQFILFTEDDADVVLHNVKRWHAEKKELTLLVNCMAGVSRSAAVAEFVRRFCYIDNAQFCKDNPIRCPNGHVVRTLMRVWMELDSILEKWSQVASSEDESFQCSECGEPLFRQELQTGICERCRQD